MDCIQKVVNFLLGGKRSVAMCLLGWHVESSSCHNQKSRSSNWLRKVYIKGWLNPKQVILTNVLFRFLRDKFRTADVNKNGTLTFKECQTLVKDQLGVEISKKKLVEYFNVSSLAFQNFISAIKYRYALFFQLTTFHNSLLKGSQLNHPKNPIVKLFQTGSRCLASLPSNCKFT